MRKQRKNSRKSFSSPIMYFLFGISVLGIVLSAYSLGQYHVAIEFSTVQCSFFTSLGYCLLYCIVIMICSKRVFGVFGIPVLVFLRAFIYSTAVYTYALNCNLTRGAFFFLYISAVFEMSGFLYLATISLRRSLERMNRHSFIRKNVDEGKVGVILAVICAIIGSAVETVLFIS